MSELNEQQLVLVCSHSLKQNVSTPRPRKEGQDQNQCQAGAAPLSNWDSRATKIQQKIPRTIEYTSYIPVKFEIHQYQYGDAFAS